MPKIAYVEKHFHGNSLALIDKINSVISEYEAQGYGLTLRQVYYQLVSRNVIPNNERSYKNIGELINNARLAGHIDWNAIEDRTRNLKKLSHWLAPDDIINSAAYSYHLDYWDGQECYIEVWVEKDALIGIVGQVCDDLDVSYFSCRGYVSQSELWGAAQRLRSYSEQGKHIVLLHLGDHDPSGIDMSRDIRARNDLFKNFDVEFHRLALNINQVNRYNPPPNPTKITDSRAKGYIEQYGHDCWELDALEPQVISDLITENIVKYRDESVYLEVKEREAREKELLDDMARHWNKISRSWPDIKDRYCR
jgi:hypothetical protein